MDSKNIAKSEVGALTLGISVVMELHREEELLHQQLKEDFVFITDSSSVIDYFCGDGDKMKDVELLKISSESTLLGNVFLTKVKSNKSEMDGFFDHDLAVSVLLSLNVWKYPCTLFPSHSHNLMLCLPP